MKGIEEKPMKSKNELQNKLRRRSNLYAVHDAVTISNIPNIYRQPTCCWRKIVCILI